jgi:hypothetical protein
MDTEQGEESLHTAWTDDIRGAQLLRRVWIAGVNEFIENPKLTWIAPWEQMRRWEQDVLRIIWQNVAPIALCNPGIDRVVSGQLIRDAWRIAVYGVVDNPKPAYACKVFFVPVCCCSQVSSNCLR